MLPTVILREVDEIVVPKIIVVLKSSIVVTYSNVTPLFFSSKKENGLYSSPVLSLEIVWSS